ncbi:MAG: hypothetical protein D6732_09615 [Methanobacteriota archaeon]|nr:MAG: hypothetical protein D6732_09615 [Euryarchaeota archaeon]
MEYQMLQKKLTKEMFQKMDEDLVDIILYGSGVSGNMFSGVSDLNFIFVIKDNPSQPADKIVNKISEIIKNYRDNPMFATMINQTICFQSQLPNQESLGGFSPIISLAMKEAKSLKNNDKPFQNINIDKTQLKQDALNALREIFNKITEILAIPQFLDEENQSIEQEKQYLAIENGLLATQIYLMTKKNKYIPKAELEFIAEDEEKENIDYEIVKIIATKRQGADFAGAVFETDQEDVAEKSDDPALIYNIPDLYERVVNLIAKLIQLTANL